jgi:hypothetical protein
MAKKQVSVVKIKDFIALMKEGKPKVLIDVRTKSENDAR